MTSLVIEVHGLEDMRRAFQAAPRRTRAEMTKALRYSALLTQRVEKQEAPIDTGYMRGSIEVRYLQDAAIILPRAKYALAVHEGTGLYGPQRRRIYPKRGKVLAWKGKGGWRFARSIAGQKPNRFADRTVQRVAPEIHATFDRAVGTILREVARG